MATTDDDNPGAPSASDTNGEKGDAAVRDPMAAIRGAAVLKGGGRATVAEQAVPSSSAGRHTVAEQAILSPSAGRHTVAEQAIRTDDAAEGGLRATMQELDLDRLSALAAEQDRSTSSANARTGAMKRPVTDARIPATDQAQQPLRDPQVTGPVKAVQSADQPTLTSDLAPVTGTGPESSTRRRPVLDRVLPLAIFLAVAVTAAVLTTIAVMDRQDEAGAATSSSDNLSARQEARLGETVQLPAIDAHIGLSDDNREAILNVCFRLSDNPNHECRPAHFEGLGELPPRSVPVPALEVHAHEVANQQYDECVDAGDCPARDWQGCDFHSLRGLEIAQRVPETMQRPALPAVCVTATEAEAYCTTLGMRLPTDVEWERIAREGDDRLQPWGRFWTPALLNWGERDMTGFPIPGRLDGADLTAPVFDYEDGATPSGVLNMLGNAAEWVVRTPRDEADTPDPPMAARGGSYVDDIRRLRITREEPLAPDERRSTLGFRCVRPAQQAPRDG